MDGTARQEEQWKTTDKIHGLSEGGDGVTGEEASDKEKWRQMTAMVTPKGVAKRRRKS